MLRYLNRLSDFYFVLARYVNRLLTAQEPHPNFNANIGK
jgi:cob(I)alamin adenosyltransferase